MAAVLIILSSFTGLIEGALIKKYNAKHAKGGFIFTALVSLFSMLFFLVTDITSLSFTVGIIPYGLISGILYSSASFLTFIALGCGPFAISMLLLSYSGVFSVIYGLVFLNETVSVFAYIGLALIVVSLFLTRGESGNDSEKSVSLKWLICITVSVIGSGMFGVVLRMQQIEFNDAYTNEFMIITLGFSALVLFVIGIIQNGRELGYTMRHGLPYAAASGVSNGATNMMGLALNLIMALSISAPIRAGVKIIFSFLLSKFVFKEKFLVRQLIGVAIGGIALVFLNL